MSRAGRAETFRDLCAALVLVLGVTVLVVGWLAGVERVTRVAPHLESMKANTAIGLIGLGAGVLLSARPRTRRIGIVVLSAVAVLGAATALEYWLSVDLGIDELVVRDPASASNPGRPGLNTSICFALLGAGIPLVDRRRDDRVAGVGQVAVLAGGSIAFLAVVAYVLGTTATVGLTSATEMALHTALGIGLVALGVAVASTDLGVLRPVGSPLAGGQFARRVLPVGLAVIILASLLVRALVGAGVIEDADLARATVDTLIAISMFVVVLAVAARSNDLDATAGDARRNLAAVLTAFPDRHYRVDPEGIARLVTGTGDGDLHALAEELPPSAHAALDEALAASRSGEQREFSFRDGPAAYEARVAPLAGGDVVVSIRNISDLAAARDELAALTTSLEAKVHERTAELERSNADLEQFASLASHDLREPLRMVSTFVEKLTDRLDGDLDETAAQYAAFASDGARRMAELVDGLLQYSRAGRSGLRPTRVDLTDVVADVSQVLAPLVEETGGTIELADRPAPVRADERLTRQIIQNLVANSLRFAAPDRAPTVRITATPAAHGMVEVAVADNGIGIAPDFHEEVFDMFRRLQGRSASGGAGIGLSLVRRLVEIHGGTVHIDPGYGPVGTRVVFTLPASDDS